MVSVLRSKRTTAVLYQSAMSADVVIYEEGSVVRFAQNFSVPTASRLDEYQASPNT